MRTLIMQKTSKWILRCEDSRENPLSVSLVTVIFLNLNWTEEVIVTGGLSYELVTMGCFTNESASTLKVHYESIIVKGRVTGL